MSEDQPNKRLIFPPHKHRITSTVPPPILLLNERYGKRNSRYHFIPQPIANLNKLYGHRAISTFGPKNKKQNDKKLPDETWHFCSKWSPTPSPVLWEDVPVRRKGVRPERPPRMLLPYITRPRPLAQPAASSKTTVVEGQSYEYHGGEAPPKATDKVVEPTLVEQDVKDAVVHETIASVEREEIQPVVERVREQTEIQQIVQPILDVQTEAPTVEHVELAEEQHKYREKANEEDVNRYVTQAEAFQDEVREEEVVHEKVYLEPIIKAVVKKKIITEIQPVIERVVHKTHIIEETQHVKETFVKAPVVHEQQIAAPMSIDEFQAAVKPIETASTIATTTSPSHTDTVSTLSSGGRETRGMKRKKLAEAADGNTDVTVVTGVDGSVDVSQPTISPSRIHGTFEKIVGVVEKSGVGELLGSDGLVAAGEARQAEGELEIGAAQAAKKRKVDA
ncbi:hypothetical protein HKX48_006690 [Thoreauomyces humboldtii]|nr:hypothetical protein HKX48_006690 [Thoreauomyces humboldtii]